MRNSVPHGAFKDTVVDKRHSEYRGSWQRGNKRVVEPDDSNTLRLYRIKKSDKRHTTVRVMKPNLLFCIHQWDSEGVCRCEWECGRLSRV